MSARYGNKIGPLKTRKSSFFKKDRFDVLKIKKPSVTTELSSNTWIRPTDWLTMPTISSSEQKIALLMPVFEQGSNFLAFTIAGAYTVDWGDGITENVATGVKAQHEYSYTDPDLNATVTSDGYKMAIVIITPQAGQNITSVDFNQKYALTGSVFPNSSPILEIILSCPNLTTLSLGNATSSLVYCNNLVSFSGINMGFLTNFFCLFANLASLENVYFNNLASIINTNRMFDNCASLTTISLFETSAVTNMDSMFRNCRSLTNVPLFNTSAVTNMNEMFGGCAALTSVPLFDTAALISAIFMFNNCVSITSVPLFNTAAVTNMTGMFSLCRSLNNVPLFNTASVTNMGASFSYGIFESCISLTKVPLFNTAAVIDMTNMFAGCQSLVTVPLFDTSAVTNMQNMFNSCQSLVTVPLFDTSAVTKMNSMFGSCGSLTSVPLFNTSAVTSMTEMFSSCVSLTSVPLFNTAAVTNMSFLFSNCSSLTSVPLFNTAAVTNMQNMFSSCVSLKSTPLFDTSNVTNMSSMFSNCFSLTKVPLFNTSKVTSMSSMFSSCSSLTTAPLFNTSQVTSMGIMFSGCTSLKTVAFTNVSAGTTTGKFANIFNSCISLISSILPLCEYTISYSGCQLSKEALERVFDDLDTMGAAGQIITITNNWGAGTPIVRNGNTTIGSTTITSTNTSGIEVGMQVTGNGSPLTTARAVTFTDTGDLVNLTNHGFSNGDKVSFATIVTTTGIIVNRIYYVVNTTASNFQLSNSIGGAALPLTTNGSGTIRYYTEVTAITPNVNITVSRQMSQNNTNSTLTFRHLKTRDALLKGWSVTG